MVTLVKKIIDLNNLFFTQSYNIQKHIHHLRIDVIFELKKSFDLKTLIFITNNGLNLWYDKNLWLDNISYDLELLK